MEEISFLENELHHWIANIIIRNWSRSARAVEAGEKIENFLSEEIQFVKYSKVYSRMGNPDYFIKEVKKRAN